MVQQNQRRKKVSGHKSLAESGVLKPPLILNYFETNRLKAERAMGQSHDRAEDGEVNFMIV